jgi:hypothetical protein
MKRQYRRFIMNHREKEAEESTISITGHGQISWELELKITCYKGQKPVVTVGIYKDHSVSKPDVLDKARQQIEESGLTKSTIEKTTSTYIGYRMPKQSGYLLMIAPRQQGNALSISIPSDWDQKLPQILRLTYLGKESEEANTVSEKQVVLWVLPSQEAKSDFQSLNQVHKTQLPTDQFVGGYRLPKIVLNKERDWEAFVRALEVSSCCVVGRDEPKFPRLENYTIPEEVVSEFLSLCLPVLNGRARR